MIKRLLPYFKPYWGRLLQASVAMSIVAALTTAIVWIIKTVVDGVLIAKDVQKLFWVCAAIPLVYLFKGIFIYAQNYLIRYVSYSIIRNLREEVYRHIQTLSVSFFHRNPSAKLMSRITHDTNTLQQAMGQVPVQLVRDGLTLIFLTSTIFYLHWKFALFTFFLFPLAAIPVGHLGKKMRRSGRKLQEQMAEVFLRLQEGITAQVITKIYGQEEKEVKRFRRENDSYFHESMRWVRADSLGAPIMEFLGSFAAVFLLWYGGRDVINGVWTTGSFFAFLGASISAYKPIKDFTSVNSLIQQGLSCFERLLEIIDEKPAIVESVNAIDSPEFSSAIEFKNVVFSYEKERPILNGIDLKINKGEIVALVGPSGGGKSTLLNLVPRLFDVQSGTLAIDGVDVRELKINSLRKQIGVVTQDVILFNESVRYNIAYGRGVAIDSVTDAEVHEAARIANAHTFIEKLPNGYNTVIGEKGVFLSGGQKQRLSIARAVLKNPPILILDEATSALDNESERLVQEALERLMKSRTVLVVAHRLSTVRRADRIIVIKDGRIVESGNHTTLLDSPTLYKQLYENELLKD